MRRMLAWLLGVCGLAACADGAPVGPSDALLARGEAVYLAECADCHQPSGEGVPRMNPPLAGSALVAAEADTLILYTLLGNDADGYSGWSNVMPAYIDEPLSDEELAAVLTYTRARFANLADPEVTPEAVATLRATLTN